MKKVITVEPGNGAQIIITYQKMMKYVVYHKGADGKRHQRTFHGTSGKQIVEQIRMFVKEITSLQSLKLPGILDVMWDNSEGQTWSGGYMCRTVLAARPLMEWNEDAASTLKLVQWLLFYHVDRAAEIIEARS